MRNQKNKTCLIVALILLCAFILSDSYVETLFKSVQAFPGPNPEWDLSYGVADTDEYGYSVVQTSSGGYVVAGYRYRYGHPGSPQGYDALLLKVSSTGGLVWGKAYGIDGTSSYDEARAVVQTSDGNYVFAGTSSSYGALGDYDFWLVKTDSNGNVIWSKTYAGTNAASNYDECYCMIQTSDGGFLLGGRAGYKANGYAWLVKADSAGNKIWDRTYTQVGIYSGIYSIVETSGGGLAFISSGYFVKTDSSGNFQWSKATEAADSMIQTSEGGYALLGISDPLPAYESFTLYKIDSNANPSWQTSYSYSRESETKMLVQTSDGGYALAGITKDLGAGLADGYLIKTSSTGVEQWWNYYGGIGDDALYCVIETSDAGLAVAGRVDNDLYLAKLGPVSTPPPPPPPTTNVKNWYWTDDTRITSVAKGDIDKDGVTEIVTGGFYYDGTRNNAQLCVWNGATLALENVKTWYWTDTTIIYSVAVGDVDADTNMEIVTGGFYYDGTRAVAQLCVWNGATLAVETVKTWFWAEDTFIFSVAVGNADGDAGIEIVTGGDYYDGTRSHAQLVVWSGATLALERVQTWYWTSDTNILSVAVANVDGDGQTEIVTGGWYDDNTRRSAQLCVWNGATLSLENVKTWYWTADTYINSVSTGNVDGDGSVEIVTGGNYYDGTRTVAQLVVWNGGDLTLERIKTWYWTGDTDIYSVAAGDVDGDAQMEIVTGGFYDDSVRNVAQLCIWTGATLGSEEVQYWSGNNDIQAVDTGDVDTDGNVEIITGGRYYDGTRYNAQLCVWA